MRKLVPTLTLLAACVFASACSPQVQADQVEPSHTSPAPMAPDFQGIGQWINSSPLSLPQLRGKVVLVEFWTYSCINCIHVLPHVKQWHADFHDQGLVVVGVHTPEYAYEKQTHNLQAAVQRFGITYPVAQDNDYRTWSAYGNQYWPALYLIDADGRIVYQHFGEGGYAQTEAKIRQLLAARRDDAPASRAP
ncbi:Thiol-disulfide isomerase or thioredoxin [Pseudoxanthomonas sp. GM95]|uniref:thioredoxin family protein n=1 Tax=Pseudoxanthomonas sp. GM95 TaxID=1881043 RepID=UPI0008B3028D|nr:thioredoxin family protein [Pseudoxanthomonas sp. GM95]SEL13013.1 Thiol-disulfide isomerase or thioredoxin [Pseudoxanthomonas sp. GM95]